MRNPTNPKPAHNREMQAKYPGARYVSFNRREDWLACRLCKKGSGYCDDPACEHIDAYRARDYEVKYAGSD